MMAPSHDQPLELRHKLAARLGPLAVLLFVVVAVSAPVAFFIVGLRTLALQAASSARHVGQLIGREAQRRPVLWKYDSLKVLSHIRTYELERGIEHVNVVDPVGAPLEPLTHEERRALADAPVIWQSAPMMVDGEPVGAVWVAVSTVGVRVDAFLMLIPFGLLAAALAGLMYWLPVRALEKAESSELARAYRELQRKELGLRELTSRAIGMQEAERRAIGRELHDAVGQALTAIRINLQLVGEHGTKPATDELVGRTIALVDDALEEVRRAVHRLGPAILDDVGLSDAVERACDDHAEATDTVVDRDVSLSHARLLPAIEATCYRVVQHALTNVARHADAGRVHVRLVATASRVHVQIHDDGRGFEPGIVGPGCGGLTGMRERVELLGGSLEVSSAPGAGTTITATIPLVAGAAPDEPGS
jgi:two-component system sensor histidine kinase UhpB